MILLWGYMISVITVNHQQAEACIELVRTILETDPLIPIEFIIVDNGSQDGSAQKFKRHLPFVQIVTLTEEVSYGEAVNRAFNLVQGNKILLTDPTVRITQKNTLSKLAAIFDKRDGKNILTPRIITENGSALRTINQGYPSFKDAWFSLKQPLRTTQTSDLIGNEDLWFSSHFILFDVQIARNSDLHLDLRFWNKEYEMDWTYRLVQAGYRYEFISSLEVNIVSDIDQSNDIVQYVYRLLQQWLFIRNSKNFLYYLAYFSFTLFSYLVQSLFIFLALRIRKEHSTDLLRANLNRKLWLFSWTSYIRPIFFNPNYFVQNPINIYKEEDKLFQFLK